MNNIKAVMRQLTKKIATFLGGANILYPSKNKLPEWMPPILKPIPYTNKIIADKYTKFNITENVCGLTVNFGFIKRGLLSNFVAYDKNGKQIPEMTTLFPKIHSALADIQRHYNANEIALQVKVLENNNYYNQKPRALAFSLYIDGIEQELKDMADILRDYNLELVPILALNKTINEKTKENYSAQSMLANVPSKGIICTNRQKSLSFLL